MPSDVASGKRRSFVGEEGCIITASSGAVGAPTLTLTPPHPGLSWGIVVAEEILAATGRAHWLLGC